MVRYLNSVARRVLFVGIILGGAAALVNLVGEGGVVGVAQDITGASAAPQ